MRTPIGPTLILLATLLAGCAASPTYQEPAGDPAATATVVVGRVDEDSMVNSGAWLTLVAVDGQSTGGVVSVRVTPGEHAFQLRHFDGWALFHGNTKFRRIAFRAEPGRTYEIRGAYCCGYFLGWLALSAIDRTTDAQVAVAP